MSFQVTVMNNNIKFWMRGTTWAFRPERGNTFSSREEAEAAISLAKKFMDKRIYSKIKIEEVSR